MSAYICEKCGCIENTNFGGYWHNMLRQEPLMCSECNFGEWHNEFPKKHWSEFGADKLLEIEAENIHNMMNATKYLKSIGEID